MAPDVRTLFETYGDFVWRALARGGVRDADLRDASQEVFIAVSRNWATREGTSSVSTWLWGIASHIAANYRRKAHRRYEEVTDSPPEALGQEGAPDAVLERNQARAKLAQILEALPDEQRMVFVMFELDERPCPEIAELLQIPLGTVYTRLKSARALFHTLAARSRREEAR